jgi:trk system potassium uptake protein
MKFIIIGCGRLGAGLARILDSRGHHVTVIDKDPGAMEDLAPPFRGRKVLGSAFDRNVLLDAGINRADGLAVVTNSDETNVVAARLARLVFRVPKVVSRLYDPRKEAVYQRLGVQIVSPIPWTVNRYADLLSYSDLDTVLSVENGDVEIVAVAVPPLLVGRRVNSLNVPGEIQVAVVCRGGKAFLPVSETVFEKGDSVHLAVLTTSVDRLKAMLALT